MMYEQYLPLVLTLLAVFVGWFLLRRLLRLTARVFSCGCLAVVGISVLLLVMRYFSTA
jgi:hypothetical protein